MWRKEEREGKPTKVPYQVTGEMAQSNNIRTWSTFHTAVMTYNKGGYEGIGFMFSKDDPYIGIDIDHCLNDGKLSPLADEVIEMMDSYTELSPSGDGIHIIVKGELPISKGTGKKNPELGLEIYRSGRYFTFTGNSQNINEVVERTEELALLFQKYLKEKESKVIKTVTKKGSNISDLSNSALWEKMFSSKNGQGIRDLFEGVLINNDHSSTDIALCNHLAFWTDRDVFKMDSMFRESALMRDKWDEQRGQFTYGEMTIQSAISSTMSTIADFEEEPFEIFIEDNEEEDKFKEKTNFMRTDLGNAERLAHRYGKDIRYSNAYKKWYLWNGKRWVEDDTNQIGIMAKNTVRNIYQEASSENDDSVRNALSRHAIQSESRSRIEAMISLAKSELPITPDELDQNKWLFNCNNGVIDLKTGEFLPHKREYYMNKISPIDYDSTADCPLWKNFLEDIMQDEQGNIKQDLIDFLQRSIGYSLTGDTSEQVLFILYGKGRNGKSTFLDTIRHLLGDYGTQANTESFTVKKNDSVRSDLATLKGSRFVSAAESEEGARLAESLIKQLTGGDPIQARFLYGNPFVFIPEFKLFFMTNYKPNIGGSDLGIWRRIRLIPFTVTIKEEKLDKRLGEKLLKEMPGILRWAVEGCLKWQKDGLGYPKDVKNATDEYQSEMDSIGNFINEVCIASENAKCYSKDLYFKYEDWCEETGEFLYKKVKFYRKIEERGFKKKKDNKGFYFQGLGMMLNFTHSYTNNPTFMKKI